MCRKPAKPSWPTASVALHSRHLDSRGAVFLKLRLRDQVVHTVGLEFPKGDGFRKLDKKFFLNKEISSVLYV